MWRYEHHSAVLHRAAFLKPRDLSDLLHEDERVTQLAPDCPLRHVALRRDLVLSVGENPRRRLSIPSPCRRHASRRACPARCSVAHTLSPWKPLSSRRPDHLHHAAASPRTIEKYGRTGSPGESDNSTFPPDPREVPLQVRRGHETRVQGRKARKRSCRCEVRHGTRRDPLVVSNRCTDPSQAAISATTG